MAAKDGDTVSIHYTGTLGDGSVFDSSDGKDPLKFKLGEGKVIPGFEQAVRGMEVDENRKVTIPSGEAYGDPKPDLIAEVPRGQLPPELNPKVGDRMQAQAQDGSAFVVTIAKVADEHVTIDANHPLAGKDLTFDIKLVGID